MRRPDEALAGALPSMPGLKELYLFRDSIGDEGAKAVVAECRS